MAFENTVDIFFKRVKNSLNSESRSDAFVLLFNELSTDGMLLKDFNEKEIVYILNNLNCSIGKEILTNLKKEIVILELKHYANLILTNSSKTINTESTKEVVVLDEDDVLNHEVCSELSPKTGPMYIDEEYCKFLGIVDE
jgi:hypothetical protein